ncbi:MAG: AsnC family transcriptional regulator [Candidatus Omnitrophota bacterium]
MLKKDSIRFDLDGRDKKLLFYLQEKFPLVLRPFKKLGEDLNLSEEEVIRRTKRLKGLGLIKRIGPVHSSENLKFKRSLVGMRVPPEQINQTVGIINNFSEVTHNYLRDDPEFNLWFTLICPSENKIKRIIRTIKEKSRIKTIISLPTVRTIKIKTVFQP